METFHYYQRRHITMTGYWPPVSRKQMKEIIKTKYFRLTPAALMSPSVIQAAWKCITVVRCQCERGPGSWRVTPGWWWGSAHDAERDWGEVSQLSEGKILRLSLITESSCSSVQHTHRLGPTFYNNHFAFDSNFSLKNLVALLYTILETKMSSTCLHIIKKVKRHGSWMKIIIVNDIFCNVRREGSSEQNFFMQWIILSSCVKLKLKFVPRGVARWHQQSHLNHKT